MALNKVLKKGTAGLFLFAAAVFVFPRMSQAKDHQAPADLFLSNAAVQKDLMYPRVAAAGPEAIEAEKIQYLISRVRRSPYGFIRNGKEYKGAKAASHIALKYFHARGRVKTARDFVYYVASASLASGQPYLIKLPDGTTYPMREVFMNELLLLEEQMHPQSPNSASA